MKYDMLIKGGKLVIPKIGIAEGTIAISDGKIAAILGDTASQEAQEIIDAKGKYILPGVIDPHVHWGLYGATLAQQTETESRSAAIGGVTMALQYRRAASFTDEFISQIIDEMLTSSHIDFSLQLFVTKNEHIQGIGHALKKWGISSFKYFMTERPENSGIEGLSASGIPEPYTDGFCYDALLTMSEYKKVVGNFHSENFEIVERIAPKIRAAKEEGLSAWDHARPEFAEAEATARLCYFAEKAGCPIYVVHISCEPALEELARFKQKRVPVYGETCPHYLALNTDSPIGMAGKVNPPLRSKANNEPLWKALANGILDTIGSDNCAGKKEIKNGDIWTAQPGFAGSATILPVLLSEGVNKGRLSLERVAEVTSYNAANIFNLYPGKGGIVVNGDADLVIIDLNLEKKVTPDLLQSWADFSVFDGWKLKGWPVMTLVRGKVVMRDGKVEGPVGYGQYIKRNRFLSA